MAFYRCFLLFKIKSMPRKTLINSNDNPLIYDLIRGKLKVPCGINISPMAIKKKLQIITSPITIFWSLKKKCFLNTVVSTSTFIIFN